ncbi:MAG TPA: protein kinase [Vicinamibacterales bacterium]
MALTPGIRLGPYEILSALGAGGMGEVYKARDSRLGRDVALKILAAGLTESPQARERFQREARAIAALSHPNICTIHDVGETSDGQVFLVMELLQGETLQQRLTRGPIDLADVVDLGIAVAAALDLAHGAGIVHRDIKPANIFLTPHGPKILDFGLAKTDSHPAADASAQATKPASLLVTEAGSTVGTMAYMSPEQLRGEPLDARTDLFSFGLVLYEMATGRPPFARPTSAVVAAAILHEQPSPPRQLRPELPERLNDIILKAIEKDCALRYQHASEIRSDLQRLKRDSDPARMPIAVTSNVRSTVAWRRKAIVVGAAVILALAGGVSYVSLHRTPTLTDKDTIVLADFTNHTGDPVFDDTLRQGLAVQLEQSPFLSLVSDQKIQAALRLMGQAADARLTPEIAQGVCARTASAAVLEGSIASLGSQYVIGLRAKSCATGETLDDQQMEAARKEDVLSVLSEMASQFRRRVGESLATVQKHSIPLEEATTSSLDALKAFSAAWKVNSTAGTVASLPLFKRAAEIDPQFAMAFANMGLAYSTVGEGALSAQSTTRAYELRSRASDPERFFITTMYDRQVTGNLERELQTLTLWAQTYPRDTRVHGLISGFATHGTGKYELCLEEAPKAIALDPDTVFPYGNLVTCNLFLERIDDAERAWQRAAARYTTVRDVFVFGYYLAFLKGDRQGMDRQVAVAHTAPGGEEQMTHLEALTFARAGQLELAADSSRRAVDVAERAGHHEIAATYEAAAAAWNAFFGNMAAARQRAAAALRLSTGRDAQYSAALALALAGDLSQSQSLAADLGKRYPEDTSVQFSYLPTLRALVALNDGRPSEAIEQLQKARSYEFADPALSFVYFFGSLYPVYMRGEAYLAAHNGAAAVTEFQKILDHRGLVLSDPMGARARLELARAWVTAGDTAKARAAYADFLGLWKDADPDTPILQQAKAEDARLR